MMLAIFKTVIILGLAYGVFYIIMKKLHKKISTFSKKSQLSSKYDLEENISLDDLPLPDLPKGVYVLPKGMPDPSLRGRKESLLPI
ncbi:MAG: hypothetical protein OHK0057_15260 [Thermoflexibacter sp.]